MSGKTICPKHEQAYPKDEGCPYCEPIPKNSYLEPGGSSLEHAPFTRIWSKSKPSLDYIMVTYTVKKKLL